MRTPLLTSSAALTEAGSLLGIVPDLNAIGLQASELAELFFSEQVPAKLQAPLEAQVILNKKTQQQIGIEFSEDELSFIHQEVGY